MKSDRRFLGKVLIPAWTVIMLAAVLTVMHPAEAKADNVYGYLLPSSSYTYLDASVVASWPAQVVCYAKNEIYARNGRQFVSTELQNWFNMQYWYTPIYTPSQFSDSMLNAYETANVQMLSDREAALGMYALDTPGYSYNVVYQYLGTMGGTTPYYVNPDTYIFYDSNTRYLTDSDVAGLTAQEACFAKNEIYARRGYIFQSQELRDYFGSKTWYYPTVPAQSFSDKGFNSIEIQNIALLKKYEYSINPNGYQLY